MPIVLAAALWLLAPLLLCATEYRLIHEGTARTQAGAWIEADRPLHLSSPLVQQERRLNPGDRYRLEYDQRGVATFCVGPVQSESCQMVMRPDFGFAGVHQALLGGRGERLGYVELARCEWSDRACLWPHRNLGQPVVLELVQQGVQPRVFDVENSRRIVVAGPFAPDRLTATLERIRRTLPDAKIIYENELR